VSVKAVDAAAACQIVWQQVGTGWTEGNIRGRVVAGRIAGVSQGRKKRWVHNAELGVLCKERLLIDRSRFHIMDSLPVRNAGAEACVCEGAVLPGSFCLQIR